MKNSFDIESVKKEAQIKMISVNIIIYFFVDAFHVEKAFLRLLSAHYEEKKPY